MDIEDASSNDKGKNQSKKVENTTLKVEVVKEKVKVEKKKVKEKETVVRIATLNVENLFARYKFKDFKGLGGKDKVELRKKKVDEHFFSISQKRFFFFNDKHLTAKTILATNADIVCLQEVESLRVVERFVGKYLKRQGYKYMMCIESKDPRLISNAIISRFPIVCLRNHRDVKNEKGNYIFSRSPLECEIDVDGTKLIVINCHFTSMSRGRKKTKSRRVKQAEYVSKLITNRKGVKNMVVLGDFNDRNDKNTSLKSLMNNKLIENVCDRLSRNEKWSAFCNFKNKYSLLDYILLNKELANINKKKIPIVIRCGLPKRAKRFRGKRLNGVGYNYPKGSDHCPVVIDLELQK